MDVRKIFLLTDVENEPQFQIFKDHVDLFKDFLDIKDETEKAVLQKSINFLNNHSEEIPFFLSFLDRFLDIRPKKRRHLLNIITGILLQNEQPDFSLYYASNQPFLKIVLVKSGYIKDDKIENDKTLDNYLTVFHPGTLQYIITEDDISTLQNYVLQQASFEFGQLYAVEFEYFMSLINIAAYYGSLKCFKYFILNDCTIDPETSHYAIASGNYEIVHILEQKNANFDEAFIFSIHFHQYSLSDWLIIHYNFSHVSLSNCIEFLNIEGFLFFLLNGDDPDAFADQQYPVHGVCQFGSLAMLKFLIENYHVNLNCRVKNDVTPLHTAASNDSLSIVEYLIEKQGIDKNITSGEEEEAPIHFACISNCLPVIRYLIEKQGVDKDIRDANGYTPLHFACTDGHLRVVKYLIEEQHVDEFAKEMNGFSCVHISCLENFLPLIQYFLEERNFDPEDTDINGNTVLHLATQEGFFDIVIYLIEKQHVNIEARNFHNSTPLQLAAGKGYQSITEYLCQHGANIETKDDNGDTALHIACGMGFTNIAQYLIDKMKANPEATNNGNKTPLHLACLSGKLDIVRYLIETIKVSKNCDIKGDSPLHFACFSESIPLIDYLIEHGADINLPDKNGYTPLHIACRNSSFQVVSHLIDHYNLDTEKRTKNGLTPLLCACKSDDISVVAYLIEVKHVKTNVVSNKYNTPLHIVCKYGYLRLILYLMNQEIFDIEARNIDGNTPLLLACSKGNLVIIQYVIENYNANKDVVNNEGQTCLHLAANAILDVIKYLTQLPIDPEILDKKGRSVLHYACLSNNSYVVEYLVNELKVRTDVKDIYGKTPLDIARENNFDEIIDLFSS